MNLFLLSLVILSIIFGATGDSRFDYGKKNTGKLLKDVEVAIFLFFPLMFVLAEPVLSRYALFIIGYIFVRFSLFDLIYAASRPDIPWDYIGSTGWYGWVAKKFNTPSRGITFARAIALATGVTMIIRCI